MRESLFDPYGPHVPNHAVMCASSAPTMLCSYMSKANSFDGVSFAYRVIRRKGYVVILPQTHITPVCKKQNTTMNAKAL
jgi:hypothetical protein